MVRERSKAVEWLAGPFVSQLHREEVVVSAADGVADDFA